MANIADCIARAREDGQIDPVRAREATRIYEQLLERYEGIMPREAAEVQAARDMKDATRRAVQEKTHMRVNQLRAMRAIEAAINESKDPATVLTSLLEHSPNRDFRGPSVVGLQRALEQQVNGEIEAFLKQTSQNLLGNARNPALIKDVVRALYGDTKIKGPAREMADAIAHVQEKMRQQFNAHGGNIGKLENRGVMQSHDANRLIKQGREKWIEDITPALDWHRIVDLETGKPFADPGGKPRPEAAARFLGRVYQNIVSGGWNTREPSLQAGGLAMYNRHADHRVLHFKNADAWMAYNTEYGGKDPFSAIMQDAHMLARDVAIMRVLGPNPNGGLEYARQVALKRVTLEAAGREGPKAAKQARKAEERVNKLAARAGFMLAEITGGSSVPESMALAQFGGSTRSFLTSVQLGGAVLSSVTDIVTVGMGAKIAGMAPGNTLARAVKLMASSADRAEAAQMGYIAETLAGAGSAQMRWMDGNMGSEVTSRMAGFTLRATGLNYWTDQLRTGFRMEFEANLARHADKAFDQLPDDLRQLLEGRRLTAGEWDALRNPAHMFTARNGAKFVNLKNWQQVTDMPADQAFDLATRVAAAREELLEIAVPTQRMEMRAMLLGGLKTGTLGGEALRSMLQYKNYALTFTISQYRYFVSLPTAMDKAQYMATMATGLLFTGALAVQLKDLAKGRDPREMDNSAFWLAALAQSGGLGIYGDFFFAETSRSGGGLPANLMGPSAGLFGDLANIPGNALLRAAEGDDPLIGRDVANLVRRNTPFFSSSWYARQPYDRLVADNLQRFLDPEAEDAFHRANRRAARDFKAPLWWEAGELTPDRLPNLPNAIGGSR